MFIHICSCTEHDLQLIHFDKELHFTEEALESMYASYFHCPPPPQSNLTRDITPFSSPSQRSYDIMAKPDSYTIPVIAYHNDHDLQLGTALVMEDPEFTQSHSWAVSSDPKHECAQCMDLFRRSLLMTVEQLKAHYRAKYVHFR